MGVFEGSLHDYNNSGQTINRPGPWGARDKFSLCEVLLPSSQPYPHEFSSTELQLLPEGIQIKERRKLSFTMVIPYSDNVDNATHVAWGFEYRSIAESGFYKIEDFKIINSSVCEISVVFDAVTTLLVNKPHLTGLVTATVNGDTPIIESYEPTHLRKDRSLSFKGTGVMCIYIAFKNALGGGSSDTGSGSWYNMKRGYANATTGRIYRMVIPDHRLGFDTFGPLLYQLVTSGVTRGGMFVQDIWFEEKPPAGVDPYYKVDEVSGSLELTSSDIGTISNPIILERVSRYSRVVAQSSNPLPYSKYDTINQPLTSMDVHISYGDSTTTIPYRSVVDYLSEDGSVGSSKNPENTKFDVVYNPTTTSSSNSKLCIYVGGTRKPLAEYDVPTTSVGPVSHPFATDYFTYEARNAVAVTEEIIQTIVALTFNISSLIDSKKKDYTGIADSILSFFFTTAAKLASIIDMKRLPIEGGGGSMTPINTLYVEYDVTPAKASTTFLESNHLKEVEQLALYERYKRPFGCAVKVSDVSWDDDIFWDADFNPLGTQYISHVQGNFIISNTSGKRSAAELREMMDVLSDGILIYKRTLVEEVKE